MSTMHQVLRATARRSRFSLGHYVGRGAATLVLFSAAVVSLGYAAPQVRAAEDIRITYGSLEAPPISVSDLESFARTGIPSRDLQLLLNVLRIDEARARQALTQNVLVDADNLREMSDTFAGQFLWRLLATTVTFSDTDNPAWELLQDAVLDTAASGELNLLDVLRTIEATTLLVDGRQVMAIASQIDFDNIEALASILLGQ
jgi:hypothetical protein